MKKLSLCLVALLVLMSLAGCSKKEEPVVENPTNETTNEENVEVPVEEIVATIESAYTITNTTGEKVTELYLYPNTTEEKGENLVPEGLDVDAVLVLNSENIPMLSPVLSNDTMASDQFVLEFVTESGYTGKFATLFREVANISLLSADAAAGATQIAFTM